MHVTGGSSQNGVRDAVVVAAAGGSQYPMFTARELSPTGAVLSGPMLLELGEQVTVEIGFDDGERVRVEATVAEIASGGEMRVEWTTSDALAQRI